MLHAYTGDGSQHLEYLHDRGVFDDLPLTEIIDALRDNYSELIYEPPPISDSFTN
ncbi:hypothetical protein L842_5662 [Mycobacterium intracellulare MIN_052511_1280]|nr:hypothetical protein L842_5662 [Mycobacterium intracellulare MIN_052511_1280]